MEQLGLQPNVVTFSILIDACAKAERPDVNRILEHLRLMKARGVKPDLKTFSSSSSAINVCAKSGDVAGAERLLQQIERLGFEPNVVTFSSLIDAYAKAESIDLNGVLNVLEMMKARGLKPNEATMTSAFGAYRSKQDLAATKEHFMCNKQHQLLELDQI